MKLEDLTVGASVKGILPDAQVTVISAQWFGSEALELTYKSAAGRLGNELIYRHDEPRLEVVEHGRPWSFDSDGRTFRLVSEAHRIRLAHLFDPVLAVHTSLVDPLPHQITAVYEAMLPRQPLRFLLADDPGAGKTIMAGLLIKELIVRGDLQRCLIVCPGSLAEQWQDELWRRFQLPFEILTNDKLEAARTGNWFTETPLVIARLDKLARNEDVQKKLQAPEASWDLVVCDEAHKLSATFFGGEIKYTKRYRLAQLLGGMTRHLLLMTATPHNGKDEDFQLFLALLDSDRFEGRFRDGVHQVEVSDLMRRMVKESLLKFDGTPLFPERIAHTVPYELSPAEAQLYREVTDYVREEFNRAEALQNDKRAGTVGFALTILQRRLASSPEAIYQSLRRRRERLEKRLRDMEVQQQGLGPSGSALLVQAGPMLDADDLDDLDDAPDSEVEAVEEEVLDQATAARTMAELKTEIGMLAHLESLANGVRRSGTDKKWYELASLLDEIFTLDGGPLRAEEPPAQYGSEKDVRPVGGPHQKFVLFTEHRDTLAYLQRKIADRLGRPDSVQVIHGGMGRQERLNAQESFKHDPLVKVLVATDAAGEGINLQRAHLMVNYDLPWNPNRLEQRFGRIHRIGQTEVCHLWNLVADKTREGEVYLTLLEKLEQARRALGGQVFDVLGKLVFEGKPLRELLIEAIRYGERPDVKARLTQAIRGAVNHDQLQALIEDRALANTTLNAATVAKVRDEMDRADARRLQPHYIESFFMEAFKQLGGTLRQRETRRYEVTHVGLNAFCDLVAESTDIVKAEAVRSGMPDDEIPIELGGRGALAYAQAISTYLACVVDRMVYYGSSLTSWLPKDNALRDCMPRQALAMTWDYAECNPLSKSSGDVLTCSGSVANYLDVATPFADAFATQGEAQSLAEGSSLYIFSTDPPYYDNISYADLSDFFYVWLRRSLRPIYPKLFETVAVPKAAELVASPYRHGSRDLAETFFMEGMTIAMRRLSERAHPAFPITIYYAFKQSETDEEDGTTNTGWDTFLEAVLKAGFSVTGTWPLRTEGAGRMIASGSNALASSIVLVCRPRSKDARVVSRREFVVTMKQELLDALGHLQHANIAPVDLAQAAIGPGMAVFSRFAGVLDAEDREISVREALSLINQALDESLAEQEGDFDADSRFAITWFDQMGFAEGEFGQANVLAQAKNTGMAGLVEAGIIRSARGKVRLLKPGELPAHWDPTQDARLTAWETVHQLVRALESGGEGAAAALVAKLGTKAEAARELAYRLYSLCERRKRAAEALSYNALVQSWPQIMELAKQGAPVQPDPTQTDLI